MQFPRAIWRSWNYVWRILPPFPQGPYTLVTRQLNCVRCQETFTIAEDQPNLHHRGHAWQSPHDQYPMTALRYNKNRTQVGVLPEVRSQPIESAPPDEEPVQAYHINCPRCGADNRNWLFIQENIRPGWANNVKIGGIILVGLSAFSIWYLAATVATEEAINFLDVMLAAICVLLAGLLPLIIVPRQWPEVRNFQLSRRFLTMLPQPQAPTIYLNVVVLYIIFILAVPGLKYGLIPTACYYVPICNQSEDVGEINVPYSAEGDLKFWGKLLFAGSLVSFVSSAFAIAAVHEIVSTVNRHLPNPIYANTSSMVRVALWEAKRALEINDHFQEIQWTLTRRNDLGGIDMEGVYRDPPEILDNGRLNNEVRRQVYSISTDRWCVILNTRINDDMGPRPAGGMYYAIPIPRSEPIPIMQVGRVRY